MQEYFEELKNVADTDKNDYGGIYGLTKEIAIRAGHSISCDGNVSYKKSFDSVLVAKWLCSCRHYFSRCLQKNPSLSNVWVDIINDTFFSFFNHLDLNKLNSDLSVWSFFHKTLKCRIIDAKKGKSQTRNGLFNKCPQMECISSDFADDRYGTLGRHNESAVDESLLKLRRTSLDVATMDIGFILKKYKYGEAIFRRITTSGTHIRYNAIEKEIPIPRSEQTLETKKDLADAFNAILLYCKKSEYDCVDRNKFVPSSFRYSWEAKERDAKSKRLPC